MDESAVGAVLWAVIVVGGLIGALGATGGILYASDFALEATIIDKDCGGGGNGGGGGLFPLSAPEVTVETKLFGITHTLRDIAVEQCSAVQKGNFVQYHIKSQRTIIYASEGGSCIYDTSPDFPAQCGN